MGRKKRNRKHGSSEKGKQSTQNLNLPKPSMKFHWGDGLWSDPRWGPNTPPDMIKQIRRDWHDIEWVKGTEWYKEKKEKGELEKH